jgi:predicted flap endonuclease-1-like 5' DNA nuclease
VSWFFGQSLPMIVLAFLLGLLAGYLIWGRRYRRLEEASVARLADPATVLPQRGPTGAARPVAAPVVPIPVDRPVPVVQVAAAAAEVAEVAEPEVAEPEFAVEPEFAAEPEFATEVPQILQPATAAEIAAEGEAPLAADDHDAINQDAINQDAIGDATPAEPQSLFDPASQPEPVAVTGTGAEQERREVDRLERVEGIGPKIALALRVAGIDTFERLAGADLNTLREALADANLRFAPSMPTWAQQARLLADGDDEGHEALTARLVAGRAPRTT